MLCWNLGWAISNHWGGWLIDSSAGWVTAGLDGYALPMLLTIGTYLLAIGLEARPSGWRLDRRGASRYLGGTPHVPFV